MDQSQSLLLFVLFCLFLFSSPEASKEENLTMYEGGSVSNSGNLVGETAGKSTG